MLFPGTQTLSLGLPSLPAPLLGFSSLIGRSGVDLPSDVRREFSDWLSLSWVKRMRQDSSLPQQHSTFNLMILSSPQSSTATGT